MAQLKDPRIAIVGDGSEQSTIAELVDSLTNGMEEVKDDGDPRIIEVLDSFKGRSLKSWKASFVNGDPGEPDSLELTFEGGKTLRIAHEVLFVGGGDRICAFSFGWKQEGDDAGQEKEPAHRPG
jgi:hypothetical protein